MDQCHVTARSGLLRCVLGAGHEGDHQFQPVRIKTDTTMGTADKHVLVEAEEIIHGQRREDYGSAEKSFQRIGKLWDPIILAWNDGKIDDSQMVALCMIQLKIARFINSKDRDSVVDIAGYAGCLAQIMGWEDG